MSALLYVSELQDLELCSSASMYEKGAFGKSWENWPFTVWDAGWSRTWEICLSGLQGGVCLKLASEVDSTPREFLLDSEVQLLEYIAVND